MEVLSHVCAAGAKVDRSFGGSDSDPTWKARNGGHGPEFQLRRVVDKTKGRPAVQVRLTAATHLFDGIVVRGALSQRCSFVQTTFAERRS